MKVAMAIPEEDAVAACNGSAHPTEECRVHPAKVRVKFIESQSVAQVTCAPPSPDVTLEFGSDSMTSPTSEQHSPDYHRRISHESGVDNPFRPDGELSREADTIVSLIKEGKPITAEPDVMLANGLPDQPDCRSAPPPAGANGHQAVQAAAGANGSAKKAPPPAPGVVDVQHGVIVPPSDAPVVEQVVIKKKSKCKCCVIQ